MYLCQYSTCCDTMNLKRINQGLIALTIFLAACLYATNIDGQKATQEDTTEASLLQDVRKTFNQNNEQLFYEAIDKYRKYLLGEDNVAGYYLCWKNEVLYDVNHNHFYRALRKTMKMQAEMERRGDLDELYKVTQLRGIIYSLRGNIPLAHQYFEKALEQVDHSQIGNLASIYMDLSNIEMDTQPEEAMKHLDCAIEIIKGDGSNYDYSDAVGFKIIVAYAMRDWAAVNNAYNEYIGLKRKLGEDFSTTYYYYALICKAVADKRYDDAIKLTNNLTNTTDIYKFQSEIYELSGNTEQAFNVQKHYMAIKDSVNNVIMSEEMMGSANDLEVSEARYLTTVKHNKYLKYAINCGAFIFVITCLLIYRWNKNRYLRKLQRQNHELLIARDKAQEANRMKASFLRNMSHEIRTPLNAVSGFSQILCNPDYHLSDEEKKDMQQRIRTNVDIITSTVNELLELSNSESEGEDVHIEKTDVKCNELCLSLIEARKYKGNPLVEIRFSSNVDDNFTVSANAYRLRSALGHLLDNAQKFTEIGHIDLMVEEKDSNVYFVVSDTGVGIDPKERERIFETFSKLDSFKEGIGLGLPLCRKLVSSMGGTVELDPLYTGGSRFVITLPKA